MARILFIDIETSPKLAYVWRFWKENVSPKQVLEHGQILSFAAIWNDDKDENVIYHENRVEDDGAITAHMLQLLDEADYVVGHNVKAFDLGTIKARALALGMRPPSPYKIIDTLIVAKKEFRFESNSLEYITTVLPVAHKKLTHAKYPGFLLWEACLKGDDHAWAEMKEYNIVDTLAVRDVYMLMRPWIANHPNITVDVEEEGYHCPSCGSTHVHSRGYAYTNVGKYQRFHCQECGKWSRTRFTERAKEFARNLLTNA